MCESCLRSGESSCSSALSSLESVKSSVSSGGQQRSRESDSSARQQTLSSTSGRTRGNDISPLWLSIQLTLFFHLTNNFLSAWLADPAGLMLAQGFLPVERRPRRPVHPLPRGPR